MPNPRFFLVLLMLLKPLIGDSFVAAQGPPGALENYRVEDWGVLQNDPRLKKHIDVSMQGKSIGEVVSRLHELTAVRLEIDAAQAREPFALLEGGGPAWKVMRQISVTTGVKARWEKVGDGYRLHYQRETAAAPQTYRFALWAFLAGVPVCLVLLFALRWRGTEKHQPPHPESPRPE